MRRHRFVVALACLALCLACGDKVDPLGEPGDDLPDVVTFTIHIKPLLDTRCVQCHASFRQGPDRNGAPPGVDYDTYALAVASAQRGNARIQDGTMPPGGLPTYERRLFAKWVSLGMPE